MARRAIQCGFVSATVLALTVAGTAFAGGYDGAYSGQITLTRGDQSLCGKSPISTTKQVVNGQFALVYDTAHNVGVNLQVQPDGSFSGTQTYQAGRTTAIVKASGRIAANVLEAEVEGYACARSYHLTKG
ncbi:MAG TPA: hypothetical protein VK822_16855 [Acetobacteraceae bacterium]|jgi:hypothetical protein|nr:hypothetical protein [Acetobacteraceae bacterium]